MLFIFTKVDLFAQNETQHVKNELQYVIEASALLNRNYLKTTAI